MLAIISALVTPDPISADDLTLQSISLRTRLSERTVLGVDAPESFKENGFSLFYQLPWSAEFVSDWKFGSRLMANAGSFRGVDGNGLVTSIIPELTIESSDGRYILDVGIGAALLSKYQFGTQDFGGPFQFALTWGLTIPVYKQFGVGYRFLHYSDAGLNGNHTIGVDFHMLEVSYRY